MNVLNFLLTITFPIDNKMIITLQSVVLTAFKFINMRKKM